MVNKYLEELKNKKNIHIVGVAGIEGAAIAVFLFNQGIKNVILHDFSKREDFKMSFGSARDYLTPQKVKAAYEELIGTGYKINYQDNYLLGIEKADLIFVSQGWYRYDSNKKLGQLKGKIPFASLTELYLKLSPCPIIGVTGTVGKSTTASLIYWMLKKCGKRVYLSGNDRNTSPILDKLLKLPKSAYLVLEISNRQLISLKYSPQIAVVTNIFPNHPDDHKNFAGYLRAKSNIIRFQTKHDFAVLNGDNKETREFKSLTPAKTYFFSLKEERGQKDFKEAYLPGEHNRANMLAAALVGHILKIKKAEIIRALVSFKGLKHRLEFIKKKKGISFYEDSQSTSPYSAASAIESFAGKKIILIMGGYRSKAQESDYSQAVSKFFLPQVKAVLLIGKVAPIIQNEYFRQKRVKAHGPDFIRNCGNLPEAMKQAKKIAGRGEIIVLSPGAESFGEFKDYRERGEAFKKQILKLFK